MTAAAAFLLASGRNIDWYLLIATLIGIGLVIASGCVFNNYIDRGVDSKMARTKKRAMVEGTIPVINAMTFASLLGLGGLLVLATYTNWLTVGLGVVGLFFYVIIYGIAKRRTVHGTLIGTIPGATPTVAGYCAVTGSFDTAAIGLFIIMVAWQMPHFYAISMYRFKDYKAAGLPVMSVKRGMLATQYQIMAYILIFLLATYDLFAEGYAGMVYMVVTLGVGLVWFILGLRDFRNDDSTAWGRKMFLFSLIVLLTFSLMLSLNAWLPLGMV